MRFISSIIVALFFFAVAVHGQCSVDVRIVARAGQESTWEEGGLKHQIYDIRVTNMGSCSITKVIASITLAAGSSIVQQWNYKLETGEISLFQALSAGQNEVYAGLVVAGSSIPTISSSTPTCSDCSSTSAPSTTAPSTPTPSTLAPSTPAPSTLAPSTPAPSTGNSTCTGYQGIYFSIAFSPSTGRYATSSGSGGYRVGYALQSCAGYPPTVNDCISLLVCVDCQASISVSSDRLANGQYVAAVATALTRLEAVERAFEHCSCLVAGTNRTCSRL